MRNLLEDMKASKTKTGVVKTKKKSPVVKKKEKKKPFHCVITMESELFNNTIAIVIGKGKFAKRKDGPGGTVKFFFSQSEVEIPHIIFFYNELQEFFKHSPSKEDALLVYKIKQLFGSTAKIVDTEEREVFDEQVAQRIANRCRRFQKFHGEKETSEQT